MTEVIKRQFNRMPLAPIAALIAALVAFALVMFTPEWVLNKIVAKIGLASVLPAAAPPLGMTAKLILAGAASFGAALVSYIAMIPLLKRFAPVSAHPLKVEPVRPFESDVEQPKVQAIEPYEHFKPAPAAPANYSRPPIFAERELGAPFMQPVEQEQPAAVMPAAAAEVIPPVVEPVAIFLEPSVQEDVPFFAAPSFTPPAAPALTGDDEADALDLELSQIADIPGEEEVEKVEGAPAIFLQPIVQEVAAPVIAAAPVAVDQSAGDWTRDVPLPSDDGYGHFEQAAVETVVAAVTPDVAPTVAPALVAVAADVPVQQDEQSGAQMSISELLERFETGLRRRQLQTLVSSSTLTGGGSTAAAADAALGQALDTLERLAANAR